ncbi:MAG TPA: metallophosphoesterase [Spirochaetota bacterium]|nr:metallophosphoesterase [Spirochaetota bacterium]
MIGRVTRYIAAFISAILAAAVLCTGCAGSQPVTQSVSFIIFGNTKPESPFSGFTENLDAVLNSIESRRPEIVIHTGNAVYGGSDARGIIVQDVERQMLIFFPMLKRIPAAVYTIPGESDSHNGTLDLYIKHSGRMPYYSFNYGSIHFITLNTNSGIDNLLDSRQMNWLKEDLEKSHEYSSVFVITHHPVFAEDKIKGKAVLKNTVLMELFIKYKVKAVFSGEEEKYSSSYYGGVEYYTTGCGGYNDKKDSRKKNQYYLVNIDENHIQVSPERVITQ